MSRRSFGRAALGTAAAGLCGLGPWSTARAAAFEPALIYDYGGKFDRSFNEAAYDGAERFKKETGLTYREFEITNENQREQSMLQLAKRGASLIVGVGFGHQAAMTKVAAQYPKARFTIIDAVVDLPNVQSIVFREQECCFLVGMIAALTSTTGKIGFVGGMDVPLIRRFAAGYAEGAKFAKPGVEIFQTMTGTTVSAWNDPARGSELARSQFDRGADVVFAAAGATGLGVLQAAADAKKLSIGCDSNQNALHPGSVLTSMVKRVDVATYNAMMAAKDDKWQAGRMSLGLKEDGLDYALDDNNRALIAPETRARVDQAKADIIAGKIVPTDVAAQ
ncbi:BMP family ABC transporter substrate-binding protein [Aliidongia sp.]|uniref:BMP family lipoprotein n=1 Tax=Aliidongia sp. TaxID=1914230 RepID=UPI002DDD1627|nr:BMP family ABC transporter substrate-binding protein [Aliidongia sp.]